MNKVPVEFNPADVISRINGLPTRSLRLNVADDDPANENLIPVVSQYVLNRVKLKLVSTIFPPVDVVYGTAKKLSCPDEKLKLEELVVFKFIPCVVSETSTAFLPFTIFVA